MAKHHPDLIMCRKQPGIAIGRLCEKCDGKCVICDSYVRPCTLVRVCDECNYGSFQGRCVICGGVGISDAYYCKECTQQEKDRDGCPKIVNLGSAKTDLFYERKKYGFKKRWSKNIYLSSQDGSYCNMMNFWFLISNYFRHVCICWWVRMRTVVGAKAIHENWKLYWLCCVFEYNYGRGKDLTIHSWDGNWCFSHWTMLGLTIMLCWYWSIGIWLNQANGGDPSKLRFEVNSLSFATWTNDDARRGSPSTLKKRAKE